MNVSKVLFFRPAARLDERAFEAIFHEHYAQVYAILFRLTGDRYEADDLAAETFWRLWERPPAQHENLDGWLYRVATRLGYNALRAGKRRSRYEQEAGVQALESDAPLHPETQLEKAQESERVRTVLARMKPRSAQLLVLRHSGLSYAETAAALELSPGSVGTLLARAEAEFEKLYRAIAT